MSDSSPHILVTGGSGFIGSHLIPKLAARGCRVRSYALNRLEDFHPDGAAPAAVEQVVGDFSDIDQLLPVLRGIEVVYHLAATTTPGVSNQVVLSDAHVNLIGSLNLIQAAAEAGVKRFIYTSSGGAVYGVTGRRPICEDDPTDPISAYGVSKLAVEKYLEIYRRMTGMEYRIARGGNPYGERQNPWRGQGFIASALGCMILDQEIAIWGDGSVVRDYLYVGDFADGLLCMLDDDAPYRLYNIGGGAGYSLKEMLGHLEAVTGIRPRPRYDPGRPTDVPYNCLDITRARQALGWEPATRLQDGLRRTYQWLVDNLHRYEPPAG